MSFANRLKRDAELSLSYNVDNFPLLAIAAPAIVVGGYIDRVVAVPAFDTVALRIALTLCVIPVALYRYNVLPKNFNWPYYWLFVTTAVFPFGYGVMLTLNAAQSPPGTEPSTFWIIQYMVAVFLFIQLISVGWLTLALWLLASVACCAPLLLLEYTNEAAIKEALVYPASAYLTAVVVGSLFDRNSQIVFKEMSRTATLIGANVAHELRTPLAGIRNHAESAARALDISDKEIEGTQTQNTAKVTEEERRFAIESLDFIQKEIEHSYTIIDMYLVTTSETDWQSKTDSNCRAIKSAESAVTRYPFNNDLERSMISLVCESDFEIRASELIVTHMIFNLIKNAIPHAARSEEKSIRIHVSERSRQGVISVTDSGSGFPPSQRRKIFKRFYTTQPFGQGSGIGLSFCANTMKALGGKIESHSDHRTYCTFSLVFPKQ